MKNTKNFRNILLVAVLMVVLAVVQVVKTFYPSVIMPRLNIPNIVFLSLLVLLLESWLCPQGETCWVCTLVLSILSFSLLPLAAGMVELHDFWKLGLVGGSIFTLTALAMDSVRDRLSSGPWAKGALVATALGIYLASQCFAGILLS